MTDEQAPTPNEPAPSSRDDERLIQAVEKLTHVVGLAVVTLDRHARLLDRHMATKAVEAVDGLVVVKRGADGSQTVTVRDTAQATQAVRAQVEAATGPGMEDEWATY